MIPIKPWNCEIDQIIAMGKALALATISSIAVTLYRTMNPRLFCHRIMDGLQAVHFAVTGAYVPSSHLGVVESVQLRREPVDDVLFNVLDILSAVVLTKVGQDTDEVGRAAVGKPPNRAWPPLSFPSAGILQADYTILQAIPLGSLKGRQADNPGCGRAYPRLRI
jgi:hypothetical protein